MSVAQSNEFNITINGTLIPGIIQLSLTSNNCYSADSFSATLAIGQPPLAGVLFWASLSNAYIEITLENQISFTQLTLITGMLDAMTIDPINGTVSLEGRDLSAALVDNFSQQDFVNQTASEIVATIAQNHGLDAVVSATTGNVGRYVNNNYTKLSLGQFSRFRCDWDLIVELARENNFDVFVEGRTLFFQPVEEVIYPYKNLYRSSYRTIRLERVLPSGNLPLVRMQSWNSQNMAAYVSSSNPVTDVINQGISIPVNAKYLFSSPNLTLQQVDQSAARYASEVGRLRTVALIEGPWDLTVSPRLLFRIFETDTILDGPYKVESLDRHYTSNSGSSQIIRASLLEPV